MRYAQGYLKRALRVHLIIKIVVILPLKILIRRSGRGVNNITRRVARSISFWWQVNGAQGAAAGVVVSRSSEEMVHRDIVVRRIRNRLENTPIIDLLAPRPLHLQELVLLGVRHAPTTRMHLPFLNLF